jgi:integrase
MATIRKRVNQNGKHTYRAEVRLKGFPPQHATFPNKTKARRWAQQTEAAIRDGRYFKTSEAQKHTLRELIDKYVRDELPKKSANINQKTQLRWWADQIGDYTLANVTPAMIAEQRDKLSREGPDGKQALAPATVVRYLAALSHAFTVAVNEWEWLDDSPVRKVKRPSLPRGRVRFLADEERTSLLEACKASSNPYLYAVVLLALSTGMRKSEILNLTWSDVNLTGGRITLHKTKNKERRVVPLVGKAHTTLKEFAKVRPINSDLLFPSKVKPSVPMDIKSAWTKALEEAEIEDFKFHDLRHTAASYLAMNGASLAEIAEVLGHKTLQMVQRYAHLSEAHTAGVVASMNKRYLGDS